MTESEKKLIESYKRLTQSINVFEVELNALKKIGLCSKLGGLEERLKQQKELKDLVENVLDGCVNGWRNYLN